MPARISRAYEVRPAKAAARVTSLSIESAHYTSACRRTLPTSERCTELIDLIRVGDNRRDVSRKCPVKVCVHDVLVEEAVRPGASCFDEDHQSRADLTCDPCRDAVARHVPGMRKRLRLAQPTEGRKPRHMT